MIKKVLDAKKDKDILYRIYKYEDEVFGEAGVGRYNISPFTKYGKTYAIYDRKNIISVIEVLFSNTDKAYIYGVSTNKDFRFKGYATELLNFAINDLKKYNITNVELTVEISNEIAINMYKHLGFEVSEYLENEYFDNSPRYLLRKEI